MAYKTRKKSKRASTKSKSMYEVRTGKTQRVAFRTKKLVTARTKAQGMAKRGSSRVTIRRGNESFALSAGQQRPHWPSSKRRSSKPRTSARRTSRRTSSRKTSRRRVTRRRSSKRRSSKRRVSKNKRRASRRRVSRRRSSRRRSSRRRSSRR